MTIKVSAIQPESVMLFLFQAHQKQVQFFRGYRKPDLKLNVPFLSSPFSSLSKVLNCSVYYFLSLLLLNTIALAFPVWFPHYVVMEAQVFVIFYLLSSANISLLNVFSFWTLFVALTFAFSLSDPEMQFPTKKEASWNELDWLALANSRPATVLIYCLPVSILLTCVRLLRFWFVDRTTHDHSSSVADWIVCCVVVSTILSITVVCQPYNFWVIELVERASAFSFNGAVLAAVAWSFVGLALLTVFSINLGKGNYGVATIGISLALLSYYFNFSQAVVNYYDFLFRVFVICYLLWLPPLLVKKVRVPTFVES